jgi:hypothetical protein
MLMASRYSLTMNSSNISIVFRVSLGNIKPNQKISVQCVLQELDDEFELIYAPIVSHLSRL